MVHIVARSARVAVRDFMVASKKVSTFPEFAAPKSERFEPKKNLRQSPRSRGVIYNYKFFKDIGAAHSRVRGVIYNHKFWKDIGGRFFLTYYELLVVVLFYGGIEKSVHLP